LLALLPGAYRLVATSIEQRGLLREQFMTFKTHDATARIGTRIESDSETLLGGSHAKEVRRLLEQRGVLVFRAINLSDAQQLDFARTLGGVIDQGEKGIFKVTLDPKENTMAEYLRGTVLWHIDGFSDDVPTLASMLSARKLSSVGGQTEFANTYAAFDDLPEKRRQELQELRVVHTMIGTQRDVFPNPTLEQRAAWARFPDKVHPLVWTHRSGRKSLVLGSSASHIVGMEMDEGRALLDELLAWATQPKFVYRHEWSFGDLVIWDNTGCMHRVEAYPADSGRMMHRTTLVGEEALV
jgi:alpha-ketoglutarate-dependent taurine dioxygenase